MESQTTALKVRQLCSLCKRSFVHVHHKDTKHPSVPYPTTLFQYFLTKIHQDEHLNYRELHGMKRKSRKHKAVINLSMSYTSKWVLHSSTLRLHSSWGLKLFSPKPLHQQYLLQICSFSNLLTLTSILPSPNMSLPPLTVLEFQVEQDSDETQGETHTGESELVGPSEVQSHLSTTIMLSLTNWSFRKNCTRPDSQSYIQPSVAFNRVIWSNSHILANLTRR